MGSFERGRAGSCHGCRHFEELIAKLKVLVPELLDENGVLAAGVDEVPFAVVAERVEHARRAA